MASQNIAIDIGVADRNVTKPSVTLTASDTNTVTVRTQGVLRTIQHTCSVAWEYSSDATNWYAVPATAALTLHSNGSPWVYYVRSVGVGGRWDTMVVQ